MKNIKDITISIFAVIGFVVIITGFTTNESNESQQITYGTPESHVWEIALSAEDAFMFNKVTGEVRSLNRWQPLKNKYTYKVLQKD